MKRRARYDWKFSDFFYNLFNFLIFCCCVNMKNKLNVKKRFDIYEKGEEKFIKDFDAVDYADNMRNLKALLTSLMDDSEKLMVKYQKSKVISLTSENSSSEESDGGGKSSEEIPKLFSSKTRRLMHLAKLEKLMVNFKNNL